MLRRLVLFALALGGCGAGNSGADAAPHPTALCPANLQEGAPCAPGPGCLLENPFSSCESSWCSCVNGRTARTSQWVVDGDPCGDWPITFCLHEGTLGCEFAPTQSLCQCDSDGTWHCACACYGGMDNTCSDTCPQRYIPELAGASCTPIGTDCVYPEHTCRCVEDSGNPGSGVLDCNL